MNEQSASRRGLSPGWPGSVGLRHPFARIAVLRTADGTKGSHSARPVRATPVPPAGQPYNVHEMFT